MAAQRVSISTAALAEQYADIPSDGCLALIEAILSVVLPFVEAVLAIALSILALPLTLSLALSVAATPIVLALPWARLRTRPVALKRAAGRWPAATHGASPATSAATGFGEFDGQQADHGRGKQADDDFPIGEAHDASPLSRSVAGAGI